ncbi:carbohydrate porin [Formicincola oecophyllae]|uniref:Carbohydrate porin n=1 Tax=Formicincola oecophyllae TaxID=2558361 RepID=A0A4Y6UBA6_9PROT|nr:carbohydrate porin [Formicincola oecophyllae]QDH13681.1 carbohydrate porin [Formicincola oecophyllae]
MNKAAPEAKVARSCASLASQPPFSTLSRLFWWARLCAVTGAASLGGATAAWADTQPADPALSVDSVTPTGPATPDLLDAPSTPIPADSALADEDTGPSSLVRRKGAIPVASSAKSAVKSEAAALLSKPLINRSNAYYPQIYQYMPGLDSEPIGGGTLARYLPLSPLPKQTGWLPDSFEDWMNWPTMTGDWDGYRTKLADMGIGISGRWLQDSAANVTGGMSRSMQYADEEGYSVDLNLQKLFRLDSDWGVIHFAGVARQGHSLAQSMPLLDSPMEIAGSGEWPHLVKLSWEKQWNRYVRTEFGELNAEDQFEASSTYWGANLYCQFESNAICGMPQSIAMNSGYGWYPTAHPGAWAKFFPTGTDEWTIQVGAYTVDNTIAGKGQGWRLSLHQKAWMDGHNGRGGYNTGIYEPPGVYKNVNGAQGAFVPVQFRWHRGGADDYSGPLQMNVTVGAYWDSSSHVDTYGNLGMFTTLPPGNALHYRHAGQPVSWNGAPGYITPHNIRNRHGAYFQWDGMLQRDKDDPRRSTAAFFSFTWGNRAAAPAPYFITFGVVRKGTFASRPEDTISIGGKVLWVSPKLTNEVGAIQRACAKNGSNGFCAAASRQGGLFRPGSESAFEMNYGYRPAWWALIRPGFQYIWSPGGTGRYKNALLLDLEAGVTF